MQKSELVPILEVLNKGIEKNKEIPIFEHFCFNGELAFASNNLFTVAIPFKVEEPFAVNGQTILNLIKASPAEEITWKVEGTDLHVKTGNSSFELPIKTLDEFVWQEPDMEGIELDQEIVSAFKYVLDTCSENQALEAFARIAISTYKINKTPMVALYSTDGDALTRYVTDVKAPEQPLNVAVTRKAAQAMLDICPDGMLVISKEWVIAINEKWTVYGQNLGESTLNYEEEINKLLSSDKGMVELPKGFSNALDRAIVVAKHETSPTSISVGKGVLNLVTETPFGNIYDKLSTVHPDVSIRVNSELLKKHLFDGLESIKFGPCIVMKNKKILKLVATQ